MRDFVTTAVMGFLMACGGGSGDPCQEGVSVLQSEQAKIMNCGTSASEETSVSTIAADIATAQSNGQQCETSLKSCTSADLSVLNSFIGCEQSVVASIQCAWFAEADPISDPSYQQFLSNDDACKAKLTSLSPACQGTD